MSQDKHAYMLISEQILGRATTVGTQAGTAGILTCSTALYAQNIPYFLVGIASKTFYLGRRLVICWMTLEPTSSKPSTKNQVFW